MRSSAATRCDWCRAGPLPGLPGRNHREPRGALLAAIDFFGREVQLLNTHLGLSARERLAQVEALLGPDWLGSERCREPLVVCGDFNALPGGLAYRRLAERLRDAQIGVDGHRPKRTWFTHYPVGRIDHVFVSRSVEVLAVEVPRTSLVRVASDHLPIVVDVRLAT